MKKSVTWSCEICGKSFDDKEECLEHEKSHLPSKMTLGEALKNLQHANNCSSSEKTLLEEGLTSHLEMFGGEYLKDLCVVPASFALNLARKLYEVTKDDSMIIYLDDEEHLRRCGDI